MAEYDIVVLFGLLGLLIGVGVRTFAPFAQKLYEGSISWNDFMNRFLALAAAAFAASATVYLGIAPITNFFAHELLLGFFIGVAGNEIANRVYHIADIFYQKRKARA